MFIWNLLVLLLFSYCYLLVRFYFLIFLAVNVHQIISGFLTRQNKKDVNLQYISMGKGMEKQVEDKIFEAAENGE